MKIYKCIALVTLILGLALCVGGVLMNGLDQLPDEAQIMLNLNLLVKQKMLIWN